jgi:acetyl esterase/lipase
MMKSALITLALIAVNAAAAAADAPFKLNIKGIAAPPEPGAIALDTGGVAGMAPESWFSDGTQRAARNVSRATLTPVLPGKGVKATGAAVVVLPGGGFKMMSMDNEGWPVARWFADHGIAAFILKYRLLPSPVEDAAYEAETAATIREVMSGAHRPKLETPPQSLADSQAALRYVRANAARWSVDPTRVGMIGFSAGAMTTLSTVQASAAADQPAFAALIYGPMVSVDVPAAAPPLFAALAGDDPLFGKQGFGLVESWLHAGRPAEVHLYQRGGHGFGMGAPGTTSGDWKESLLHWLDADGLLVKRP